jgi:1,4-alpha-glucan branching enzyme
VYAFQENFVLVLSHDEVVHGKGSLLNKMPGDPWQKFANLRMFYAWMYAHPGKKLLFMGCEIGQGQEWNHDRSVDWHLLQYPLHDGLRRLVQHLNFLYKSEPAFSEDDDSYDGFEWIDFYDADSSIFTFLRKGRSGSTLLFAVNATPGKRVSVFAHKKRASYSLIAPVFADSLSDRKDMRLGKRRIRTGAAMPAFAEADELIRVGGIGLSFIEGRFE